MTSLEKFSVILLLVNGTRMVFLWISYQGKRKLLSKDYQKQ